MPPHVHGRGLTLIELLVVIAILGAMATAIVPSVRLVMAHSTSQDTAARLKASWQMALALARSQERPVLWRAVSTPLCLQLTIEDAHGEVLRAMNLPIQNARIHLNGDHSDSGVSEAKLVVYPHGLSENVSIQWQDDGGTSRADVIAQDQDARRQEGAGDQ